MLTPSLALKRLIVMSQGNRVYDESFHYGVNIIRGANGSGKSTIADFIFFVLGGQLDDWKPEAERCNEVIAEIEINRQPLTLRRSVLTQGRPPTYVYWGEIAKALQSASDGWQVYSVQRSTAKESFSQMLFRALDFPEVKGDLENNITMHQVLRLIYLDQLSAVQSLMRDEAFDTPITRTTVGDLLFGIFDDSLYSDLRAARGKERTLESLRDQIVAIEQVIGSTNLRVDAKSLAKSKLKLEAETIQVDAQIAAALNDQLSIASLKQAKGQIEQLSAALGAARGALSNSLEGKERQQLEVQDSELFIAELQRRLAALEESILTHTVFGELPLTHCPQCFAAIKASEAENACPLCRESLAENARHSHALRMKHDLAQQISESEALLTDKRRVLAELELDIVEKKAVLDSRQAEYDNVVKTVRTIRENAVDELFVRKGKLQAEIENNAHLTKITSHLTHLQKQAESLVGEIATLKSAAERKRRAQDEKRREANTAIEGFTLDLLRNDLEREEFFRTATKVAVDFGQNTFAIDGRNNFSASAIAYLKASVHFAIFFASLQLDFFRYPRFIICDNIEDKGMEQPRSQNFQRLLVERSNKMGMQHQVIFTTSMIDPGLNNTPYCVGPEYSQTRKTLNFTTPAPKQTNLPASG